MVAGMGRSAADVQVHMPPSLTSRQRAWLHEAAEAGGIPHESVNTATGRCLVLGALTAATTIEVDDKASRTDAALKAAVCKYFPQLQFQVESSSQHEQVVAPLTVEATVERFQHLLQLEKQAEIAESEQQLQSSASTSGLKDMRVSDMETGLLGRTLVTLITSKVNRMLATLTSAKAMHSHSSQPLPPHRLTPHDVVAVRPSVKGAPGGVAAPLCQGVVYRLRDDSITIAVEELPEEASLEGSLLRIDKLSNEVTFKRYAQALAQLPRAQTSPVAGPLVRVLLGLQAPREPAKHVTWTPLNKGLDPSQLAAVTNALAAPDVALIHGPPGTGKTTAVVEYIQQEAQCSVQVARGNRVLACAASNIAVDNIVERLAQAQPKLPLIRVGHPARLLPTVLSKCLEAAVQATDNSSLAKDCAKEIKQINQKLLKLGKKDYVERKALRTALRSLVKEQRVRESKAVKDAVHGARVIAATLTGVGSSVLEGQTFDVAVIDEAAQAVEPACWCAVLRAKKAVLAGDHLQLPPTVISDQAAKQGLSRTMFERLQGTFSGSLSRMLTVQYRMHESIMTWASDEMYGGLLEAHQSVAGHMLQDLQHAGGLSFDDAPVLLLIDTNGCDMPEDTSPEGSKANQGEAQVALAHVLRLLAGGLRVQDIGIITPYAAQVALLKQLRSTDLQQLEVNTVDGFQGREKEAIIISMVRSNDKREVGFLADNRRMNVAVTRARRHCCVICDSETVSQDAFLGRLLDYFGEHGEYASAQEYTP